MASVGSVHTLCSEYAIAAVVEIVPWQLSQRPIPRVPGVDDSGRPTEAWLAYRAACLQDVGLADYQPTDGTHDLFDIARLPGELLEILLNIEVTEHDIATTPLDDASEALYGGLLLLKHGAPIHGPGCCCTLSDIEEWVVQAREPPTDWYDLWVGHDRDTVQIRKQESTQIALRVGPFLSGTWREEVFLSQERLEVALEGIRLQSIQFKTRIQEYLGDKVDAVDLVRTSAILAGLGIHC